MPFLFCPYCGTQLQPGFNFCPSCGKKLPSTLDEPEPVSSSPPQRNEALSLSGLKTSLASSPCCASTETQVSPRPSLRKTRNTLRLDKEVSVSYRDVSRPVADDRIEDTIVGLVRTPTKQCSVSSKLNAEVQPPSASASSPVGKTPRAVRGKAKLAGSPAKQVENTAGSESGESAAECCPGTVSSPIRSPSKASGKGRAKRAKHMPAVEALQEGEEVTDTTGKKWKLIKRLSQSTKEIFYEVLSRSNSKESHHILKLGAKDGRIFNEQNFLQRAAKPASVEKWMKTNRMDFLGIPSCAGFGPHADSYRFLIFPNMGQCLQSVMEEENRPLSEKTVIQLACRIVDVLQYIHSNEYVHADISAENIFIQPEHKSQVYLAGYYHAFRYFPGGQHVEYREASRTPHEGTTEFISLDAHKGAAPSRRSDLQSLGYCLLHWHTGSLPWTTLTNPDQVATQKQRYMEDVPALLSHCFGKKRVSNVFKSYLTSVMALQYSEQPDYSALKDMLSDALLKLGGSLEEPLHF
ncbi:serine/threonine-protein kinase VRK3 isoform X2 [Halichoeres trimaculatus]|uniref:serine/threonine-protein kinase VRK3 isoform X2 n=1 Tax=Halichoeres trimaculatus TaxID=147232 RepID=UPI003D9E56BB